MQTSAIIEVNSAKLHSLLDSGKTADHRPDTIDELEGLVAYLAEVAPSTREHGEALLVAAHRYYGDCAPLLANQEKIDLSKAMRTAILLIATQKAKYARSGD